MCACKLSTKLQHSCIFLIRQKQKQPYKAVICVRTRPPPLPLDFGSFSIHGIRVVV